MTARPDIEKNTGAQVSENPLDYLCMIVYVKRGLPLCERLVQQAAKRMDILIQDVANIKGQRPPWLKGVPTVVMLPSREIMTGSRALHEVNEACQQMMQGADAFAPGSGPSAAPLREEAVADNFSSLFTCADEASSTPPTSDLRYEDQPTEKTHDISLEDIMRRRGGA